MLHLGIDQHAKQITISLRDDTGTVVLNRQVSTEPTSCLAFLTKLRERAEGQGYVAIVEVCGFNDWLLDLLPKYGCVQTVLIQPDTKRKVKTDRRDAKALSELLWLNRDRIQNKQSIHGVRQVVLPTVIDRENQRLTSIRQQVGRQHTRTINQIKHILRRHNLQWQMPTKTFPSKKAIEWVKVVELPSCDRSEMNWHIDELKRLATKIESLDAQILARAEGDKDVELLRTIPGVAYFTALALSCRIGDPKRFSSGKGLSNYWGLTPSTADSGDAKGRRGHITKAGSKVARWLLGQIVVHVLRKDPLMKLWYKPIRNRRGSRIARVAVMRRLTVIIRNMLVEGQDYRDCRNAMFERRKKQVENKVENRSKATKKGPLPTASAMNTQPVTTSAH